MKTEKNDGPNFLRAWRLHREMTLEEVAAKIKPPTTASVISYLEEGERGLSAKWLRRLAPVLKTTPGRLLDLHPSEVEGADIHDIWDTIPEGNREQALRILETFRESA